MNEHHYHALEGGGPRSGCACAYCEEQRYERRKKRTSITGHEYPWTIAEARELAQKLQPLLREVGFDIGLTGSVFVRGESERDLDLIIYPLTTEFSDVGPAREALRKGGLECFTTRENVLRQWRRLGSSDSKFVEVWMAGDVTERKRIDVFFLR